MNNSDLLLGKTIASVTQMQLAGYDDIGFLKMEFTDGSVCYIEGGYYEGYTDNSEREYPTRIWVKQDIAGLSPLEMGK